MLVGRNAGTHVLTVGLAVVWAMGCHSARNGDSGQALRMAPQQATRLDAGVAPGPGEVDAAAASSEVQPPDASAASKAEFVPAGRGFHCYSATVLLPPRLRIVAAFTACFRTAGECTDSLRRVGKRTHRVDQPCRGVERRAFCHKERVAMWSEYGCYLEQATCEAFLSEDKRDESDPRKCLAVQ